MATLLVTSLRPGDGKTAFCAGLAHLLSRRGANPLLIKPVAVTDGEATDRADMDADLFTRLQDSSQSQEWPVQIDVGEAMEGLSAATLERVRSLVEGASRQVDDVIVEGPSLTTASGDAVAAVHDLAEALDAQVVLLLCYTPTLSPGHVVETAGPLGGRLVGVVVNRVLQYRTHWVGPDLVEPLKERGLSVLATLPEERRLLGVTVGQISDHLEGEFLIAEEKRDDLVDHLMIGGLVLDKGTYYFSRSDTKAVIVRGDRPDIQMAALATPTRCLVLTGGHRPIQYIEHEAREEEVPLILVQSDTLSTARALESMFEDVAVDHPDKVAKFADLLEQGLDVAALGLGLSPQ